MPNWNFILVSFSYHVALSIWIGGIIILGAIVAPALFRRFDREDAGQVFGGVLRTFLRVRILAVAVAIVAAMARFFLWESSAFDSDLMMWIIMRWTCLVTMAVISLYEVSYLEGQINAAQVERRAEGEGSAARRRFDRLHARSTLLVKVGVVAALGALLLS